MWSVHVQCRHISIISVLCPSGHQPDHQEGAVDYGSRHWWWAAGVWSHHRAKAWLSGEQAKTGQRHYDLYTRYADPNPSANISVLLLAEKKGLQVDVNVITPVLRVKTRLTLRLCRDTPPYLTHLWDQRQDKNLHIAQRVLFKVTSVFPLGVFLTFSQPLCCFSIVKMLIFTSRLQPVINVTVPLWNGVSLGRRAT